MQRLFLGAISPILGFLMAVALPVAVKAQTNTSYTITPWVYVGAAGDCGSGTAAGTQTVNGSDNVVSRWVNDMGNPSPSLYLQKAAPTTDCSSAGATIYHVNGITLSNLSFDYYSADQNAHCGAGSPRFNVVTNDNVTHFFGCASGTATNLNNGWTHVTFSPTDSSQAFPVINAGSTVTNIQIVFDETGYTHLDNIGVNGQSIGRGTSPWNKADCKKNGYKNLADNNGNFFKNQGQCVSYVEHNQHFLKKTTAANEHITSATANTTNRGQ